MTAHTPPAALLLDARRQAMLKAMGVELWWQPASASMPASASVPVLAQQTAPDSAPVEVAPAPAPNAPHMPARLRTEQPIAVEKAAAPVPVPAAPAATTAPIAPAAPKRPAVAMGEAILWRCGAASLVKPAAQLAEADAATHTSNASGQHWLFVTDDFSDLGEDAQAAEQLLQNMWRAMRLHRHPALWRSSMERVPPSGEGKPGSGAPLALDDVLNNALATAAPAVVVLMGRVAAQTLLQTTQPLGVLRQQPHRVAGVPAVATYSPSYLLRAGHAKAGAWADLQRALELARNVPPAVR